MNAQDDRERIARGMNKFIKRVDAVYQMLDDGREGAFRRFLFGAIQEADDVLLGAGFTDADIERWNKQDAEDDDE